MYIYIFSWELGQYLSHLSSQVAQTNYLHTVEVQYVFFLFNEPELFPEWVCVPTNIQVIDVIIKVINIPSETFQFPKYMPKRVGSENTGELKVGKGPVSISWHGPTCYYCLPKANDALAPHSSQGKLCLCPVGSKEQGWGGKEDK